MTSIPWPSWLLLAPLLFCGSFAADTARRPASDADLRFWLENMAWHHQFTTAEMAGATGLAPDEVDAALARFGIRSDNAPRRPANAPLRLLPYPGGRHPRIGFLDGAIDPQRETKASVFLPWAPSDYVVVDVPEAIWSNLGLTYLAHTHIPTVWSSRNIDMMPLEWQRTANGSLEFERLLPNGIRFGTRVQAERESIRMQQWLHNGTSEPLSDLRVQNCVMLKGAPEFAEQTSTNKVFAAPYVACRSATGDRWVITAWVPSHRVWGNAPVPCLHADPKFPDCAPGDTVRLAGWLSFFEGADIHAELKRIDDTGWQSAKP